MANARGKAIDNTHLSIDQAEARGFIHRDYIAHCLRWTHVAKHLQRTYKTARVLDIGCGVDLPLARLLYSSRLIVKDYVGVEYNGSHKFKLEPFHSGLFPISAYGSIDFNDDTKVELRSPQYRGIVEQFDQVIFYQGDNEACEHLLPNTIVSFEMIEHIEPGHARAVMEKVYRIMRATQTVMGEDPVAFISTPCWDPQVGAAGNHVNEMLYSALGAMFESIGFKVEAVAGTFASQKDYKSELGDLAPAYNALAKHYDSNYLATIFAPLFPERSRNALWTLRVPTDEELKSGIPSRFPPLKDIPGPWTSSEHWADLARPAE